MEDRPASDADVNALRLRGIRTRIIVSKDGRNSIKTICGNLKLNNVQATVLGVAQLPSFQ